jgi:hypothetical protein
MSQLIAQILRPTGFCGTSNTEPRCSSATPRPLAGRGPDLAGPARPAPPTTDQPTRQLHTCQRVNPRIFGCSRKRWTGPCRPRPIPLGHAASCTLVRCSPYRPWRNHLPVPTVEPTEDNHRIGVAIASALIASASADSNQPSSTSSSARTTICSTYSRCEP